MSTGSNTNKNYKNNKNNKDKVKITTELTIDFEVSFALHKDQCYLSEEIERKEDGKMIFFLTNILDLSKKQIADIYKHRWDIEALFQVSKTRTQPQQNYLP